MLIKKIILAPPIFLVLGLCSTPQSFAFNPMDPVYEAQMIFGNRYVCPDLNGSETLQLFSRSWDKSRSETARFSARAQTDFKQTCSYWQTHKQDKDAIDKLSAARASAADINKKNEEFLKATSVQMTQLKNGALKDLKAKDCIARLERLEKFIQGELSKLEDPSLYECN